MLGSIERLCVIYLNFLGLIRKIIFGCLARVAKLVDNVDYCRAFKSVTLVYYCALLGWSERSPCRYGTAIFWPTALVFIISFGANILHHITAKKDHNDALLRMPDIVVYLSSCHLVQVAPTIIVLVIECYICPKGGFVENIRTKWIQMAALWVLIVTTAMFSNHYSAIRWPRVLIMLHLTYFIGVTTLDNPFVDFYSSFESFIVQHSEHAQNFAFRNFHNQRHKFHLSFHAQVIPVLFSIQVVKYKV